MKLLALILLTLAVVWLWADFVYSRIIARRLAKWEASVERDADGVRKHCGAFTVGDGETAVLLIHGFNNGPPIFAKMAPALAEHGFTCRAMRLPGFGEPTDRYAKTTREQWIAAVEREVAVLRESHGHVVLVGHSLGGAIAIAYVLEHPDAADGIVLLAPAIKVSNARSPLFSVRTWHRLLKWTLVFTHVVQSNMPIDVRDPAEKNYPWSDPFIPRSVVDQLFLLLDANRGRAADLRTPLLMALSEDDQVIDSQAAKEYFNEAASTSKELRIMDRAGHAIPIDYGWRELTSEIAGFARSASRR